MSNPRNRNKYASLRERHGKLVNDQPAALYRYRKAGDFTLSEIERSEIYFANFPSLNDPFEVTVNFEQIRVSDSKGSEVLPTPGDLLQENMSIAKEVYDSRAVCCFSEKRENAFMWTYYAEGYKGVCFEYTTREMGLAGGWFPVKYYEKPPMIEYNNDVIERMKRLPNSGKQDVLEHIGTLCASKSQLFQHEEEWRVFHSEPGVVPVKPRSLVSITFGFRVNSDWRRKCVAAAKKINPDVRFYLVAAMNAEMSYDTTIIPWDVTDEGNVIDLGKGGKVIPLEDYEAGVS